MFSVFLIALLTEAEVITHLAIEAVLAGADGFEAAVTGIPGVKALSFFVCINLGFDGFC